MEGKVTSNQEGIYAVAECDDNFSGHLCASGCNTYIGLIKPRDSRDVGDAVPYNIQNDISVAVSRFVIMRDDVGIVPYGAE